VRARCARSTQAVPTPQPARTLPRALIREPLEEPRRETSVRPEVAAAAATTATAGAAAAAAAVIADDASRAQEVGRTEAAGLVTALAATSVTTEAGAGTRGSLFYAPPTNRVMPDAFDASKVCVCVCVWVGGCCVRLASCVRSDRA